MTFQMFYTQFRTRENDSLGKKKQYFCVPSNNVTSHHHLRHKHVWCLTMGQSEAGRQLQLDSIISHLNQIWWVEKPWLDSSNSVLCGLNSADSNSALPLYTLLHHTVKSIDLNTRIILQNVMLSDMIIYNYKLIQKLKKQTSV